MGNSSYYVGLVKLQEKKKPHKTNPKQNKTHISEEVLQLERNLFMKINSDWNYYLHINYLVE